MTALTNACHRGTSPLTFGTHRQKRPKAASSKPGRLHGQQQAEQPASSTPRSQAVESGSDSDDDSKDIDDVAADSSSSSESEADDDVTAALAAVSSTHYAVMAWGSVAPWGKRFPNGSWLKYRVGSCRLQPQQQSGSNWASGSPGSPRLWLPKPNSRTLHIKRRCSFQSPGVTSQMLLILGCRSC